MPTDYSISDFYKSDGFLSFFIIIIFFVLYIVLSFTIIKNNITNNLDTYRCNPSVMPYINLLGINSTENFNYCVKKSQTQYMGNVMRPINNKIDATNENIGAVNSSITDVTTAFSTLKNNISNVVDKVYNSMGNMAVQNEKIQHKNNDNFKRLVASDNTMLYLDEINE